MQEIAWTNTNSIEPQEPFILANTDVRKRPPNVG